MLLMVAGFVFGFAGLVLPNQSAILQTPRPGEFQFQRLHIFLFNLVAGGTILIWFTEKRKRLSWRGKAYIAIAFVFSLAAFFNHYASAIILAVALAVIVEAVRIAHFSFFPVDFFRFDVPVSQKFHHAAMLCLSLGLLISAGVMLDNQYLHLGSGSLYLLLDDFFLGFSFPLSLITFAVIFALMKDTRDRGAHLLREASFWIVTLGVIVFFIFIILDMLAAEIAIAAVLLADVLLIFYLFRRDSEDLVQSEFLTSGLAFLTFTGFTGILLLLWQLLPSGKEEGQNLLLQVHAYLSLYGWNLSGLTVIIRYDEFPLRLHDTEIILLHWVTIVLLAPLGSIYPVFALLALPTFVLLLTLIFFFKGQTHIAARRHGFPQTSIPFWPKTG
jgi:hypothetical protein